MLGFRVWLRGFLGLSVGFGLLSSFFGIGCLLGRLCGLLPIASGWLGLVVVWWVWVLMVGALFGVGVLGCEFWVLAGWLILTCGGLGLNLVVDLC